MSIVTARPIDTAAYYENYAAVSDVPGRWLGGGRDRLGLGPEVNLATGRSIDGRKVSDGGRGELALLLEGVDPTTGERLVPDRPNRRRGFDLTFSAPKSVSIVAALHPDPAVRDALWEAHRAAVAQTMAWIEEQYCASRRGHEGRDGAVRARLCAAAWDHATSRAGDPQMHTHVVAPNLGWGDDGKLRAIDWGRILGSYGGGRGAVGDTSAVYGAALRAEIRARTGLGWTDPIGRDQHREIAGVVMRLVRQFSDRRGEILDAAGIEGTAKSRQAAVLATRQAKEERPAAELMDGWRARLAGAGWTPERLAKSVERAARKGAGDAERERERRGRLSEKQLRKLVAEVGAAQATWTERDLAAHVARSMRSGVAPSEIAAVVAVALATDEAVVVAEPAQPAGGLLPTTERRYASRTLLDAEANVVRLARTLTDRGKPLDAALAAAVAAKRGLADEQVEALRALLAPGFVHCVRASAGAGKTLVVGAAADAWRAEGREVVGLALAWRGANELASAGIEAEAIDAALSPRRERPWAPPKGGVVVVDEASMVTTPKLATIFELAERADAQVVLVGDNRQLGAVAGAGGLFARLAAEPGTITLTANRRQVERWERRSLEAVRAGRSAQGLDALARHGRIVVAPDEDAALGAMIAGWREATLSGGEAVLLSATRAGRDRLAAMAHATLVEAGVVRPGGVELAASDKHGGVAPREIAGGDRVRFLSRRAFGRERGQRVVNGTEGVVAHATSRHLVVELDSGKSVRVPVTWAGDHVAWAYAATIAASQGRTVGTAAAARERVAEAARRGTVYLWAPENLALESAYVGLSRAADSVHLYTSVAPSDPATGGHLATRQGRPIDLPTDARDPLAAALRRWREAGAERAGVAEIERSERVRGLAARSRADLESERRRLAARASWWLDTTPQRRVEASRAQLRDGAVDAPEHRRVVAAAWAESRRPPDLVELVGHIDELDDALAQRRHAEVAAIALSGAGEPITGPMPEDPAARVGWWSSVGEVADAAHATGVAHGVEPDEALRTLVEAVERAGDDARSLDELVAERGAAEAVEQAVATSGGGAAYRRIATAWAALGEEPRALTEAVRNELADVRNAGPGLWARVAQRRLEAAIAVRDDVPIAVAVAAIAPEVAVRAVLAAVREREEREAAERGEEGAERGVEVVVEPVVEVAGPALAVEL